jgi:MFS family permease
MKPMRSRLVTYNLAGTALFLAALAVAIPFKDHRFAQFVIGVVSVALFAAGIATSLWAYTTALERSRIEEVGVANLYLLTGDTAPKDVKRRMLGALAVQVVAALAGAIVGVTGLQRGDVNALAFGWLVPMFGIGMNGAWAARYGSYGPRVNVPSTSKKNG